MQPAALGGWSCPAAGLQQRTPGRNARPRPSSSGRDGGSCRGRRRCPAWRRWRRFQEPLFCLDRRRQGRSCCACTCSLEDCSRGISTPEGASRPADGGGRNERRRRGVRRRGWSWATRMDPCPARRAASTALRYGGRSRRGGPGRAGRSLPGAVHGVIELVAPWPGLRYRCTRFSSAGSSCSTSARTADPVCWSRRISPRPGRLRLPMTSIDAPPPLINCVSWLSWCRC